MSRGKTRRRTSENSNTSSRIDQGSRDRINGFNQQADNFLNQPFQNYVPGLSDQEQQARTLAGESVGSHNGLFDQAEQGLQSAFQGVSRDRDVGADIQRYLNPFEEQVIDANNADFAYGLERNQNDVNARVALDGGYGSDGHALGLAEAFGQSERARNSQNSQLRYQNYNQALERDYRDTTTQAGLAQQYAALAGQRQQYDQNDIGLLDRLGANERAVEQSQNVAAYQDQWQRYNAFNNERRLAGSLADTFGNTRGTSNSTETTRPGLFGTLGTLGSLASSFAPGGSIFGQAVGAAGIGS